MSNYYFSIIGSSLEKKDLKAENKKEFSEKKKK
jgi:hypothetical protein